MFNVSVNDKKNIYRSKPVMNVDTTGSGGETTTLFKNGDRSMILKSSTEGSTKKFKITVDDSGTISATEVI